MSRIITVLSFWLISTCVCSQVVLNELVASNATIVTQNGLLTDWIELRNFGNDSVDLSGWHLSDNLFKPTKWTIPEGVVIEPNGYIVFNASNVGEGLETNFGLSALGETITFYDDQLQLLDSISYPELVPDVAYGRFKGDSSRWVIQFPSSPAAANAGDEDPLQLFAEAPIFDIPGGVYPSAKQIQLNGANVHYTLDGSEPVAGSFIYSEPITINDVTVVRARSFVDGKIPSPVISNTYFIGVEHDLPIVSVSMNPKQLWNDTIGINTVGINGIGGLADPTPANFNNEWKRAMNFEYFADGTQQLSQAGEIAMSGLRRNSPNRPFKIAFKGKYGASQITYPFFDDRVYRSFTALTLRHGGYPDFRSSILRDGIIHEMVSEHTDVDYRSIRPTVLYLNGEYWGISNIREKQNENYLEAVHGVERREVDVGEYSDKYFPVEGDISDFLALRGFLINEDPTTDSAYDYIASQLDIDNCLDYHITNIYLANADWPWNNVRFWRSQEPGSKWKFILTDADYGFGFFVERDHNTLAGATSDANKEQGTLFIRNLLRNPTIRDRFIQRFAAHMNDMFDVADFEIKLAKFKERIESEIPRHVERWKDCDNSLSENSDGCPAKSVEEWESNVQILSDFMAERTGYVQQHIEGYFGLNGMSHISLMSNDTAGGYFKIDGVEVGASSCETYFNNAQIHVEAVAKPGYRFAGWRNIPSQGGAIVGFQLLRDTLFEAEFVASTHTILPELIPDGYSLTFDGSPYLAVSDVIVPANVVLSAESGVEVFMVPKSNLIVYGGLEVVGDTVDPVIFRPYEEGVSWGNISFHQSTDSSILEHAVIEGAGNRSAEIDEQGAISIYESVATLNNVIIEEVNCEPVFSRDSRLFLTSCSLYSSVPGDLVNAKGGYAEINNCTFTGNRRIDTDAIDYDNITDGVISNNKIQGFYGFNSDGIDLGEGSKGIIVTGNVITDCSDKGVSIGQASSAILINNVFVGCDMAVGVKDSNSTVSIDRCTFYDHRIGVGAFEKNINRGGGGAVIKNCIFSQLDQNVFVDEKSSAQVTYTLTDDQLLSGVGNITGDPMFLNAALGDLSLASSSPAIDAGDPSQKDADSTVIDMGAKYSPSELPSFEKISINEVMASNASVLADNFGEYDDWVELYNANAASIDIAGLYVSDELGLPTKWRISNDGLTRIPGNGYYILWFDDDLEQGVNHVPLKLSAQGESVSLAMLSGSDTIILDELTFGRQHPDTSFGRYYDGEPQLLSFTNATPNRTNSGFAPYFVSEPIVTVIPETAYLYSVEVKDLEFDQLTISAELLPSWLTLESQTKGVAVLSGTAPALNGDDEYDVILKVSDGLDRHEVSQSFTITISDAANQTFSNTPWGEISLYPNPTRSLITLSSERCVLAEDDAICEIVDVRGVVVYRSDIKGFENQINVSQLSVGIYFLKVAADDGYVLQTKIVKY